jgi:cytochrome c5
MNTFKPFKALAVVAGVLVCGLASSLFSAEPPAGASSTNAVEIQASSPLVLPAIVKKQLTGAELYSIHCNRCHPERYPTERTAAQWKTVMLHMQVRASIPGKQARLILQYLQENSGR